MAGQLLVRAAEQPLGGMVLIHGQGDHAMRHEATLAALAAAGITTAAPDLPGHGTAAGRRGHIGGIGEIDSLVAAAVEELRALVPGKPIGLAGHSMGGLFVADYFARGNGEEFSCVWMSSPLIEAGHGKPAWLQRAGKLLARVWPSFTIRTGVRPGDSVPGGADPEQIAKERASGTHNRVSVGWGGELLAASRRVDDSADLLFGDRPVLITHGDADRVCPLRHSSELFERLPSPRKELIVVPGGRHEPWHDPEVVAKVCAWAVRCAESA